MNNVPQRIYHCIECLDANWNDIGSHRPPCHQLGRRKYEYTLTSVTDKRLNHCIKANKTILQELVDSSKQKEQVLWDRIKELEHQNSGLRQKIRGKFEWNEIE